MSIKALDRVRTAHLLGSTTRKEIHVMTGLDQDLVDLCVDLLIQNGEIKLTDIKGSCTIGGCNSCAEDATCHPREVTTGPIPITLSTRMEK